MENQNATAEKVKNLYSKYSNKQHFLNIFGTKKFHLVDDAFLQKMYDFLITKVK